MLKYIYAICISLQSISTVIYIVCFKYNIKMKLLQQKGYFLSLIRSLRLLQPDLWEWIYM